MARPLGEDLVRMRPALIEIAETAGRELFRRFPGRSESSATDLEVEFKGGRDLVTDADRASESLILDRLGELTPDIPILSEERADPGVRHGALWIVDPLDGTTNFAHGHPLYSVSIALTFDGQPLLAVIHAPEFSDTWSAVVGGGTERNGHATSVSPETELSRALLATGFSYERIELETGGLEVFAGLLRNSREVRRGGSACLDLAYVASGIFSGFWESDLKPHDVAAGALLVREAGGTVTDFAGGETWLYGRTIVAGSPLIHAALLEAVKPLAPVSGGNG